MIKTPDSEIIRWLDNPRFELITDDGQCNRFRCVEEGLATLGGNMSVRFPKGWISDVTSTPLLLHPFLPQLGPHAPAALLHDRLLNLGKKRSLARLWMWRQLKQLDNVTRSRRYVMFLGVWIWDHFTKVYPENTTPDGALKLGRDYLTHERRLLASRKETRRN